MASVIKRGKRWYAVYRDVNGKQKWVRGYADKVLTQRLANRLDDGKIAIQRGEVDPATAATQVERLRPVAEHIRAYEDHLRAKGCAANHIAYTAGDIRKLVAHSAVTQAGAITKAHVDQWVLTLVDDSPRTINRRVGSVQAFLRYLHEHGTVSRYVLKGYGKRNVIGTEKRKYRHLELDEIKKLIASTADTHRNLIYRFALGTGFRFSEVASMTPGSFDFENSTVTVRANDAKNKARDQVVPLHPSLHDDLKKLCKGKSSGTRIFNMPERHLAAKELRGDCIAAGVSAEKVVFHSLRHSFITNIARAMVHPKVLQMLARHSSVETTMRFYSHFRQADERAAVNALPL